jgi:hypothetical protein
MDKYNQPTNQSTNHPTNRPVCLIRKAKNLRDIKQIEVMAETGGAK